MNEQEKVFFSILRSALWGSDVEVPEDFSQWGKILQMAKIQALLGLVGDVMLSMPQIKDTLPEKMLAKLQDMPILNVGLNNQMSLVMRLVFMTLREHGIEPVLLKGLGLSSYYPIPELRQCGDLDIYVGDDNYEKAYDAIKSIASEIDDKAGIWDWMHFDAKLGAVYIEVHHKADYMHSRRGEKIYRKFMLKGLSEDLCKLRFGDLDVMTPNDTFNAFYVFYHLWRHFATSGVGLRQFCDWTCFLHAHVGKLDLSYLRHMLESLGFMKPWQVFGCFIVNDLGLPKEEFPFYDEKYAGKVDKVRAYVMADGNFGITLASGKYNRKGYLHGKFVAFKYHVMRIVRMFPLFPLHTLLRVYYMFRDGILYVFKDLRKALKR